MDADKALDVLANILVDPTLRWFVYLATLCLVVYAYILEPIRFSNKIGSYGIPYKYETFIVICLTLFFYTFIFLGLWMTIPFTDKLPEYWYVPVIGLIFAIIAHFSLSGAMVMNSNKTLNPPPSYAQPTIVRKYIYYLILGLDIVGFIQGFIYSGIKRTFKNTILHQFFLNRFGGLESGNILNFATEWFGLVSIVLDAYWIYGISTFVPCKYDLPNSWAL